MLSAPVAFIRSGSQLIRNLGRVVVNRSLKALDTRACIAGEVALLIVIEDEALASRTKGWV